MSHDLTLQQWALACLAAVGIGVSKSGLPGVSLLHVVLFAQLFPGLQSTGVVLPMLVVGDIGAVLLFRRHADWHHIRRTLPPAGIGVVAGWGVMSLWGQADFRPVIGVIVLALAVIQLIRHWRPETLAHLPHTRAFAWSIGLLAGGVTMVANAAGPVMALYLVAVSLPKNVFVGTSAWFFLILNVSKVPFSAQLGLIQGDSLRLNLILIPAIVVGLFLGKATMSRVPQRLFDTLIIGFAFVAALRLLWH
jgi:uncharacterized membrane protein YfcA